MNTSLNQGTAKIYQFPAGGRSAAGTRRIEEIKSADLASARVSEAACGDGWYHQAAILESNKPPREH